MKLNKSDLFKLLETVTSESSFILIFFSINKQYSLCPTLANAFLCHYKKEWLENCPSHFKPTVYRSYVDDIFVLFSSKEHLQPFVDYMNKQHRCIKFTSENQQNNTFSFLDINTSRQNNQVKTSAYRKPTFSGVFTHYESYIDQSYKKSLIFIIAVILFDRTTHCSIWKLKS